MTQAAVAGIGQTTYAKGMGRTELDLACEAIRAACTDAGLPVSAVDGFVSYHIEQVAEVDLVTALGLPDLRLMARTPSGGGGGGVDPRARRARGRARDRRVRGRVPCPQSVEDGVLRCRSQSGRAAVGEGRRPAA